MYKPRTGNSAWLVLRQSVAYFSQVSLQLGSAGGSGHHQGNRHKRCFCVLRGDSCCSAKLLKSGLSRFWVLPCLAYADCRSMERLLALGCPVWISVVPTAVGRKGLTTGGPYVQLAARGTWGVTPVQLFKLEQLGCLASPVNVSART